MKRRHNIEMGFRDATGFHPIRASRDYSYARAGENDPGVSSRLQSVVSAAKRRKRSKRNPIRGAGSMIRELQERVEYLERLLTHVWLLAENCGSSRSAHRATLDEIQNVIEAEISE